MKLLWKKPPSIFFLTMLIILVTVSLLFTACQNNNIPIEGSKSIEVHSAVAEAGQNKGETDQTALSGGTVQIDEIEGRNLYIYLPANYHASDNRYPVVYMHDGQNLFDSSTSAFGVEWEVDEALDKLGAQHMMKDVIVVGVANGGSNRALEYVPFEDPLIPSDEEFAEAFTKYFIDEIIPYVDDKYRTIPDRDNRMIMGSSFGGIQAFWMGYHHPEVFSAIGALSPSTWVANQRVLEEMDKKTEHPNVRIWLDMGGSEDMEIDALVDVLTEQGYKYGEELFYLMDKNGQHNELSWAKRVHNPLLMFGGDAPEQVISMEVNHYITNLLLDGTHIRINPVVTLDNGMSFTVSRLAAYKVLNPESGKVDSKGNVTFLRQESLEVEVSYKGLTMLHTIEY
ncbi:Endo-1,4-beta-xylanase/feruloyl esterase precursor [compost metagenome]